MVEQKEDPTEGENLPSRAPHLSTQHVILRLTRAFISFDYSWVERKMAHSPMKASEQNYEVMVFYM